MSTSSAPSPAAGPTRGEEPAFAGAAGCGGRSTDARSGRDLVDLFLERIERPDPRLSAFRSLADQPAEADRAQARIDPARTPRCSASRSRSRTSSTSRAAQHPAAARRRTRAATDSEVVRRLRAAGAVPLGITNVPELTIWPFTETESWGKTANPWDANRTPGGSSGGSAAAAAAPCSRRPWARTAPIDPHPSRVVRPLRHQAAARPDLIQAAARALARHVGAARSRARSSTQRFSSTRRPGSRRGPSLRPRRRNRSRRPRSVSPARFGSPYRPRSPTGDRARLAGADRRRLDRRPAALARPRRPRARPRLRLRLEPRHAPLPAASATTPCRTRAARRPHASGRAASARSSPQAR